MAGYVRTSEDNGGVHTNSGIPNHAFYLAAVALGGHAWEKAGRIWYETLRDKRLKPTATFLQFARYTVQNAAHLFGTHERQAVAAAWAEVGVRADS
jgi:Zn-dependent metalloprotease